MWIIRAIWLALAVTSLIVLPTASLIAQPSEAGMSDAVYEGVLQPSREVSVASAEAAIIKELRVKAGSIVEAGDVIAILDSSDFERQLAIARAEYQSLGRTKQVESELEMQQMKVKIIRELFEGGRANIQEVDRAETDLQVIYARLLSEKEGTEVHRLQVERLENLVEQCTIRAPIGGTIVSIEKQVGEYVATHSPTIVKLHDTAQLKATFPLSEQEVLKLQVDHAIPIRLSDGKRVTGTIDYIPPVADPESGWFMVTVLVDNADGTIRSSRCSRIVE